VQGLHRKRERKTGAEAWHCLPTNLPNLSLGSTTTHSHQLGQMSGSDPGQWGWDPFRSISLHPPPRSSPQCTPPYKPALPAREESNNSRHFLCVCVPPACSFSLSVEARRRKWTWGGRRAARRRTPTRAPGPRRRTSGSSPTSRPMAKAAGDRSQKPQVQSLFGRY
jgi:hypothetical protein